MDNNQNKFIQPNNNFQTPPNNQLEFNDINQQDNDFLNNNSNTTPLNVIPQNNNLDAQSINDMQQRNDMNELNNILTTNKNKFINNDVGSQENLLNSLNIETGEGPRVDYSREQTVQENLKKIEKNGAKNTITINSEGKVFLIIIALLLIFIFALPTIFDYVREIMNK